MIERAIFLVKALKRQKHKIEYGYLLDLAVCRCPMELKPYSKNCQFKSNLLLDVLSKIPLKMFYPTGSRFGLIVHRSVKSVDLIPLHAYISLDRNNEIII